MQPMDTHRQLAKNEALFRDVNERVAELNDRFDGDARDEDAEWELICECVDDGCLERIRVTKAEYDAVRSDPTRFALALGHEFTGIERVVEQNERFAVGQKFAEQDVLIETDPRS